MPVPQTEPGNPTRERVIGRGLSWLATWSLRWLLIAAGAVLLGLVVRETWVIILPVLLALILTSVLEPLARMFESRLRFPSSLAAGVALLTGIAVVVSVGFAIAPSVRDQADDIANDAISGLQELQDWVQRGNFVTEEQIDTGIQALQDRLTSSASSIASGVVVGVGAVGSAVITVVLALILTFFFLKDGRRFTPWLRSIAGDHAGGHVVAVSRQAWGTLGGFIRTQAVVSLFDAVLIGVGLLIVGVPLAIPLAILTFFGGFVPIVGAFVVGGVAVLVALVSVGLTGALIVLGIIIGVQQLEGNVLQPWLQSRTMDLHAGVVLLSVALGSTAFGVIGAFLAVPVVAVAAVFLRYLNEQVTVTVTGAPAADPDDSSTPAREPEEVDADETSNDTGNESGGTTGDERDAARGPAS